MGIVLIRPLCIETDKRKRLYKVLDKSLENVSISTIETLNEFENADLKNKKILFAINLGESGVNLVWYQLLKAIRLKPNCFEGSIGAVIVDGNSELYTKDAARHLVFSSNASGCTFIGRPLVEGTKDLLNHNTLAKYYKSTNQEAYEAQAMDLVKRLETFSLEGKDKPKLLALHAGNYGSSNSLSLWEMVRKELEHSIDIKEISLRNGEILDCIGCPYNTCLHYGEQSSCFYGGVIVEKVYPGIIECDGLMMICANYNDSLAANLSAFINRMTAPFRVHDFSNKMLFSIVVSGYSGGDLVAQQLISGINMNKSFILPSRFAILETANDPDSILKVPCIQGKASDFGKSIKNHLKEGIKKGVAYAI